MPAGPNFALGQPDGWVKIGFFVFAVVTAPSNCDPQITSVSLVWTGPLMWSLVPNCRVAQVDARPSQAWMTQLCGAPEICGSWISKSVK